MRFPLARTPRCPPDSTGDIQGPQRTSGGCGLDAKKKKIGSLGPATCLPGSHRPCRDRPVCTHSGPATKAPSTNDPAWPPHPARAEQGRFAVSVETTLSVSRWIAESGCAIGLGGLPGLQGPAWASSHGPVSWHLPVIRSPPNSIRLRLRRLHHHSRQVALGSFSRLYSHLPHLACNARYSLFSERVSFYAIPSVENPTRRARVRKHLGHFLRHSSMQVTKAPPSHVHGCRTRRPPNQRIGIACP